MTTQMQQNHRPRIGVIVGSTRPQRRARIVADWVIDEAASHLTDRAQLELIDLADVELPMLDEAAPAAIGSYAREHTRAWSERVDVCDAYVFVTPEYNHSLPGSLKNAIDFLFAEWNDKPAGFVSYGLNGGVRAVEHLRLVLAEVKVAGVRSQVALNLFTDFDIPDMLEPGRLTPAAHHAALLGRMLDELMEWAGALSTVRRGRGTRDGVDH